MSAHKIYCVSKTWWAAMWRDLRNEHSIPVISSWIDHWTGESNGNGWSSLPPVSPGGDLRRDLRDEHQGNLEPIRDWGAFWMRCLEEASTATCALVYLAPGEQLVGGMAEIGAVLSHGGSVLAYGHHESLRTLAAHPRMRCRSRLEDFTAHPESMTRPERWLFELAKYVDGK